jgi:glycosyltransferase involved in cell wall biosynthesis
VQLVVVHYHYRPGGIRRIIELALPHLCAAAPAPVSCVTLLGGEAPDEAWLAALRRELAPLPVSVTVHPALGYFSELNSASAERNTGPRIAAVLNRALADCAAGDVVWAHNLGIGRNLHLSRALADGCAARGLTLVAHHHDWWFDNRWARWPEMRRAGFRTLDQAGAAIFPAHDRLRHFTINQFDLRPLQRGLDGRVAWLPNLTEPAPPPPAARLRAARAWLRGKLDGHRGPVWLLPCRLLRRKNMAEALLLTRWFRPDAWLVTTGGVSSADEQAYARKLADAARRHGWALRLGVLAGDEAHKPSVSELLAASEAVLLTSVQEGFGLPYLEAAAAGRPLIARNLPNVAPDLARLGFRFPQNYDDVLVPTSLLDWRSECRRQRLLFARWRRQLPSAWRARTGLPAWLDSGADGAPVPFSRLTLTGQLEVLAQPVEHSWLLCAPLNPWLNAWRQAAGDGRLHVTPWPKAAGAWLSGPAYARRFWAGVALTPNPLPRRFKGGALLAECIANHLRPDQLFPLLWGKES